MKQKIAWTIAGSDPTGAAGVAADLKAFQGLGVHGCPVITAVTAQNHEAVSQIQYLSLENISAQIKSLAQDFKPDAIKLGMLGQIFILNVLQDFLKAYTGIVILDPLLYASSGNPLFEGSLKLYLDALKKLFPHVDLITPNLPEAEHLLGRPIASYEEIEIATRELLALGAKSVLIKGGHFNNDVWSQDYWSNGVDSFWLTSKRSSKLNYRGTGCVLSSSITSCLALGYDMKNALVISKMVVNRGIRLGQQIDKHTALLQHGPWPEEEVDLPYVSIDSILATPEQDNKKFPDCGRTPLGLYPVVDHLDWLKKLLPLGVLTIQLRLKNKNAIALEQIIQEAILLAREYNSRLFINDHWQLAIKHGAYGVHLGQEDLNTANLDAIRQAGLRLGISTHCYYEVARAHALAPSYMAIGPLFSTTSKIMAFSPQGITQLKRWRKTLNYPLVAIGGITLENMEDVIKTGVDGIAMISAITEAKDPIEMTKILLTKFCEKP